MPKPEAAAEPRVVEASIVLTRRGGHALVLRRRPDDRSFPHAWSLPGGSLESGETPAEAAHRETAEESGLAIRLRRCLGPRRIVVARRGLVFDLHRFVADAEAGPVVLSDEHVAYRWLDPGQARRAAALLPGGLAGEVTAELLDLFADAAV